MKSRARLILSSVFSVLLFAYFYSIFRPGDSPGFMTFFTTFVFLPAAVFYWLMGKVPDIKLPKLQIKPEEVKQVAEEKPEEKPKEQPASDQPASN